MSYPVPILIVAMLALSLGACQKKEESTYMPEASAPAAPAPEPNPGEMVTPPAPSEGGMPQQPGSEPSGGQPPAR